jgi:hypothetical protein
LPDKLEGIFNRLETFLAGSTEGEGKELHAVIKNSLDKKRQVFLPDFSEGAVERFAMIAKADLDAKIALHQKLKDGGEFYNCE